MELKEATVEKLTCQCRDLERRYEQFRIEYEQIKDLYATKPTLENHRKLHEIHRMLIMCSEELSELQNKLIEAYWSYFGVKHWQFKSGKERKRLARA